MIINVKCSVLSDSISVGVAALCRVCFHHLGFSRHVIMGNTLSFNHSLRSRMENEDCASSCPWNTFSFSLVVNLKSTWFIIIIKYIFLWSVHRKVWGNKNGYFLWHECENSHLEPLLLSVEYNCIFNGCYTNK